mgnify:CR=1 FL=1
MNICWTGVLRFAQDLDHAKWAQVPREAYLAAARYLVQHNVAYQHLEIDEDTAREQFLDCGATCAAVRAQASQVGIEESMPTKLSGPAELAEDQIAVRVSEADVDTPAEKEASSMCQETADDDRDEDVGPGFNCAAGEVSSSELDVERCCKELAAKVLLLMERSGKGQVDSAEIDSLRGLAASLSRAELQQKLDLLVEQMDAVEGRAPMQLVCRNTQLSSVYLRSPSPG